MPDTRILPDVAYAVRYDSFELNEQYVRCVIAQVQFGQATRKCRGTGICKVDLYTYTANGTGASNCNRAICRAGVMGCDIVLMFDRYALCKRLVNKYFCKGGICLREDLELDELLCKKLGIAPTIVAAGRYVLIQEGSRSTIIFKKELLRDKKPNH